MECELIRHVAVTQLSTINVSKGFEENLVKLCATVLCGKDLNGRCASSSDHMNFVFCRAQAVNDSHAQSYTPSYRGRQFRGHGDALPADGFRLCGDGFHLFDIGKNATICLAE